LVKLLQNLKIKINKKEKRERIKNNKKANSQNQNGKECLYLTHHLHLIINKNSKIKYMEIKIFLIWIEVH